MSAGWSLTGRLLRRVVLGVSIGWLVGLGLSMWVIAHEMGELLDDTLAESAQLSLVLYQASGSLALPEQAGDSAIRIIDKGREVVSADWPPQVADGGQDVGDWRVYRLSDRGSGIVVETGQSNEWRRDELLESLLSMLLLMLPVLLITVLAVSRLAALALRPATGFARRLQLRKATDLSPVPEASLPRELAPIPLALNGYLARLRDQIEAERLFATNAAHELRNPIAAASAQAQLIARGVADPDAAQRMTVALDRLALLVERLLQLSRAEAGIQGEASCDLVQVTRMVIAQICPEAIFDDGDQEEVSVPVHPDAVALILANLLRNASDHGTGDIRVRLLPGPVLVISNRITPEAQFRHGTFEKSPASRGTGLGLSIVAKIAEKEAIGLSFSRADGRAEVALKF
ncbi:histidine kinase dimerization/phospho-acceptor domain-containing protein [uncultured Paracoccus sp.]|uniref:sensor histidine kinase n=1 Tax=uncultured Paracoccus sp. TaxID=189685 RepID=UPI0026122DA7|nr:histidine kinase dimerization/phospho-acceptor domain-containing protein [uncultured Paracoccus sp.]